jgi:hypothetical protein
MQSKKTYLLKTALASYTHGFRCSRAGRLPAWFLVYIENKKSSKMMPFLQKEVRYKCSMSERRELGLAGLLLAFE